MVLELTKSEQLVVFSAIANALYPEINYELQKSDIDIMRKLMQKLKFDNMQDLLSIYVFDGLNSPNAKKLNFDFGIKIESEFKEIEI